MSFTREELGKHLYLYRQPIPTTSVVVASHGGYRPSTRTFDLRAVVADEIDRSAAQGDLQNITVYFFKRHGFANSKTLLQGLGATEYASFEKYVITNAPGEKGKSIIVNYELSKFHEDDSAKIIAVMKQINADKTPGVPIRDVITIRNRKGPYKKVITLEKVIRKAVPLGYRRFYCLFCRSQMEDSAVKFQAMKEEPFGVEEVKMIPDGDYKQWERTRKLEDHGWK
jgi:hypothetical protein